MNEIGITFVTVIYLLHEDFMKIIYFRLFSMVAGLYFGWLIYNQPHSLRFGSFLFYDPKHQTVN